MFGESGWVGLGAGEPFEFQSSDVDPWDEDLVYGLTVAAFERAEWETGSGLPAELELLSPGIVLAAVMGRVDRSSLSGFDLVRLLRAEERLVSHFQAGAVEATDAIAHLHPTDEGIVALEHHWEFAADEVRAALTLTRHGATARLDLARNLVDRLPALLDLLGEGRIDLHRARVVVRGTSHLDADEARNLVDSILEDIPDLTSGELAALLRKLAVQSSPERAKRRYETAVEGRRVWIEPSADGTAHLHAYDLPVDRARAIGRRLNGYALSLRNQGDTRTMDQLRTDVFCDLLDTSTTVRGGGKGLVDIRVDLTTLAGLDDKAAEIPGMGPVIADIARQIAVIHPKNRWQYTVVDSYDNPVFVGVTRRRPNTHQTRMIRALNTHCVFPGCRMPATQCDIDHNTPWSEGGPTSVENSTPKCRHDHTLRHQGRWKYRCVNGQHVWTSPLGHTYTKNKPP
jgi:hypothetical protein